MLIALADDVAASLWPERVTAFRAALFAAAVAYSVPELTVEQSRRDIGIRVALGARVANLIGLIGAPVAGIAVTGALSGPVAAWFSAPRIRALLDDSIRTIGARSPRRRHSPESARSVDRLAGAARIRPSEFRGNNKRVKRRPPERRQNPRFGGRTGREM